MDRILEIIFRSIPPVLSPGGMYFCRLADWYLFHIYCRHLAELTGGVGVASTLTIFLQQPLGPLICFPTLTADDSPTSKYGGRKKSLTRISCWSRPAVLSWSHESCVMKLRSTGVNLRSGLRTAVSLSILLLSSIFHLSAILFLF